MIKLIKNIFLLLLLTLLADRMIAYVMESLFYKQHHGDDYVSIQVLDSTRADIIIMGSSRASHHYISDSLEKWTGFSTFNGGRDNTGIQYTHAVLKELFRRHKPKFLIFDIIPYSFILDNQSNQKYLDIQTNVLLPFAGKHQQLYDDIAAINKSEVWKSKLIKTYPYNSLIGSILQNSFTKLGHQQVKGYEPLRGDIDTANYHHPLFTFTAIKNGLDQHAFHLLEESLEYCMQNHVKPIICFSPFYFPYHHEEALIQTFEQISLRHQCTIVDLSSNPLFVMNPHLFYDELHLNDSGAGIYSKIIAGKVKELRGE